MTNVAVALKLRACWEISFDENQFPSIEKRKPIRKISQQALKIAGEQVPPAFLKLQRGDSVYLHG
jgi:hypothetical protein